MSYLLVFHQGSYQNGQLWVSYFDGTNWTPDTQVLNVGMSGSPSAVVFPDGRISVFHQGSGDNGQLWYSYFDGANWEPDKQVPNVSISKSPSAIAFPGGGISVFHQGSYENGQLWYTYFDGGSWRGETQVPNVAISESPSAVVFPDGHISVFHQGSYQNGQLWYTYFDGKTWGGETQVPNVGMSGSPSAVVFPEGHISVFYQGPGNNGQLRYSYWNGTNWEPDKQVPNVGMSGSPSAVALPGGAIAVFHQGLGENGQIWYSYFNGTNWQPDTQVSSEAGQTTVAMSESPGAVISPIPITSPARWMARLPNTRTLSRLTLPGTHESCTAFLITSASCQNWSLLDQVNHGIRYVDIRCRHTQNKFPIYHDIIFTGLTFDTDVRDVCITFLKANPSECIVMQVRPEGDGGHNTRSFQATFDAYVQGFESFFYLDRSIPTLGEVRGKIVVVRRFDLDNPAAPRGLEPLPWKDNTTFDSESGWFHIQDQYNVPTILPGDINAKRGAVSALLGRASADASDDWYINFASGSSSGAYPNAVAAQVNPSVYDYLGGAPFANRLGTLMLDFPEDSLIRRIIALN